jgi:hypothetical protein
MQFSAQSCAPLFSAADGVVPPASSPDFLLLAQPINQVRAAHEIIMTAPGKSIHLQIREMIPFMAKSQPLPAS